jgi:transcriptional regulator with XRE-family HTH domain
MARAALHLSLRELAARLDLSAMALSRYENTDTSAISVQTMQRIAAFFTAQGVFFGPKDGVCIGVDVFHSERWLGLACYQLLVEAGVTPTSRALLEAYARLMEQAPPAEHAHNHAY